MRTYPSICLGVPELLLPRSGTDLSRWSVIACDQYTSEPAYWERVAEVVGDAPSTLHLVFPEVYLGAPDAEGRIARIKETMRRYVDGGLLERHEGMVYVERQVGAHVRRGLVAALDLEQYDFKKGSTTPIRATEGTILDRIPPRVRIREGAAIELPHIMVLLDDPGDTVLGPLAKARDELPKLYDFDLMLGSGRVRGRLVPGGALEQRVVAALGELARPEVFAAKCGVPASTPVLLHAMGDGNHSLATAKAIWEDAKEKAADRAAILESPLRYALVELVNLHDPALVFEPIHRIVFGVKEGIDFLSVFGEETGGRVRFSPTTSFEDAKAAVDAQVGGPHKLALVTSTLKGVIEVEHPEQNLPVGTLQAFLDAFMTAKHAREVDYVHGTEPVLSLGVVPGNVGLYLPPMAKEDLFRTVVLDGALPRKTFSMGEAPEKRFYLEARRLA